MSVYLHRNECARVVSVCMLDQSLVCVHRGTVYAYIFVGVSVRVL